MTQFSSRKTYSFDTEIAKALGVEAAILYNDFVHWISFNVKFEIAIREGMVWSFSTYKEIADRLGFLNERQVRHAVEKLVDSGLIIKGEFNSNKFDRTCWFTVTDPNLQPKLNNSNERQICQIDTQTSELKNSLRKTNLSDRSDKFVRSNIGKTSNVKTYKEQQQQRKKPAAPVVVPSELQDLELQEDEVVKIIKLYKPEEIKLAVQRLHKWADRESDIKALKWLLKYPDKWVEPTLNDSISNKELSHRVEKALIAKGDSFIDAYPDCVCLDRNNPIQKNMLSYESKGFRDQLDSALRKKNTSLKELNL